MNDNDVVDTTVEQPEKGGIVTTVKAEESKDLDFVRRLNEMRGDPGDDGETEKEKPAKAASTEDEDWQKNLSPRARQEVNRLYKDLKAARRDGKTTRADIDDLKGQIAELKNGRGAAPVAQEKPQLARPAKPDPLDPKWKDEKDFRKAEEEYEDKLYEYRKALDAQKDQERRAADAARATIEKFNDQVDAFSEIEPTYAEVMDDAENEVSDLMFGAIMEEGPALGFYFATHPDESSKIARLSIKDEKAAIKAILRISMRLEDEAEAKAKKKPEASAPAKPKSEPIKPVTARAGSPTPQKDKIKMTFKEREREYARTHPGALNYNP